MVRGVSEWVLLGSEGWEVNVLTAWCKEVSRCTGIVCLEVLNGGSKQTSCLLHPRVVSYYILGVGEGFLMN